MDRARLVPFPTQFYGMCMVRIISVILNVKMKKLSHSQALWLIQVHKVPEWQNEDWDLFPPSLDPGIDGSNST